MTDQQNPVQPPVGTPNPVPTPSAPILPAEPVAPVVPPVSYVDDYQPPSSVQTEPLTPPAMPPMPSVSPAPSFEPVAAPPVAPPAPAPVSAPMPVVDQPAATSGGQSNSTSVSQALEDQNIFFLLGVDDSTDEEKESFLDELQQVIWEDFLENDVQLLITEEEKQGLKQIQDKTDLSDEDRQEEMVVYLEKLIPDLEEIMLEKALELKEDMVKERLAGMRDYFAGKPEELKKLDEVDELLKQDKWRDAAAMLNDLKA